MKRNNYNNKDYQSFVNICESAFPQKVEDEYLMLATALSQYYSASFALSGAKTDEEVNIDKIINHLAVSQDLEAEYDSIVQQFNEMKMKVMKDESTESIEQWLAISRKKDEMKKRLDRVKEVDGKQRDDYTNIQLDAGTASNQIALSIERIKLCLKNISELDIDDQKRINRLELTSRHFEALDAMPLSEEQKYALINVLKGDFDLKKSCFYTIEKNAETVVSLHNKGLTLDEMDDYERMQGAVALTGLEFLGVGLSPFQEIIPNNKYSLEQYRVMALVQSAVSEYLSSGTLDIDLINSLKLSNYEDKIVIPVECLSQASHLISASQSR